MSKKQKEKKGTVQFLIKYKILLCIILCILYFLPLIIYGFLCYKNDNFIESLCYISQIISGLFVVLGTVIAVLQYIFNSNTAKNEADKQRKIEAANMANEFRQNIIPLINSLSVAYRDDSLYKEIIDYLDKSKLVYFNKKEMDKLFPNDKYLQYRGLIAKNYLLQTDPEVAKLFDEYHKNKNLKSEERQEIAKKINEHLNEAYKLVSSMCTDLSNSLEYMCICFNTNIADDETVYQSLHNVFFTAVHLIYIFTFDVNINEHDRLFYNIMVLYKKWKMLNIQKKQEEENNKAKFEEDINKLKEQYDNQITIKTKCN